jgi:hypothetical protein
MEIKKIMHSLSKNLFRLIRWIVKQIYPKISAIGIENLPDEPAIVVGNHTQMNGPICGELYFPGKRKIWCAYQMMKLKEVPAYAYQDFWSGKPVALRPFYRILSYIIAPLSVCVFNNARTIAVYHDIRLRTTFKKSIQALKNGANIIIFPECYDEYNHIVNNFQDKFVDIAKMYFKQTGKELSFVPLYISPALRSMHLGKPVRFCPDNPIQEERTRICNYLKDEITRIAEALPLHKVVPYANIPKTHYKTNTINEVNNENTRCKL